MYAGIWITHSSTYCNTLQHIATQRNTDEIPPQGGWSAGPTYIREGPSCLTFDIGTVFVCAHSKLCHDSVTCKM